MDRLEALRELAAKVEAGLDTAHDHAGAFPSESAGGHCTWHDSHKASGGSLDAAKALHHPVSQFSIVTDPTCAKATYCFWPDGLSGGVEFHGSAYSETASVALLLAYLYALIAQEESK